MTGGLLLDAGGGACPQVTRRLWGDVAQRAQGQAVGVIRGGDVPTRLAPRQMLVEPGRLGRVERGVDPLRGSGPRAVVRRGPVVGPARDAPECGSSGPTRQVGVGRVGCLGVGGCLRERVHRPFGRECLAEALAGPGQQGSRGDMADAERRG